ncbi:hypothetical protein OAV88_00830 [bacterium]|nr:hypothetical protein [bacterium]
MSLVSLNPGIVFTRSDSFAACATTQIVIKIPIFIITLSFSLSLSLFLDLDFVNDCVLIFQKTKKCGGGGRGVVYVDMVCRRS